MTGPDPSGARPGTDGEHPGKEDGTSGKTLPTCDLCGASMIDRHCKLTCPTCGYQRDCSDP